MKRNKHINVVKTSQAEPETNSLIMTDSAGKLIKASGIQLSKDFANIADKIAQAKGGKLDEGTKALLEMTEVWTPDMVDEPVAEEKPKARRTRKPKAEATTEEKPKKTTRKKKEDAPIEEKPKAAVAAEEKPKAKRTRKPKE